jgi:PKD repeat protein
VEFPATDWLEPQHTPVVTVRFKKVGTFVVTYDFSYRLRSDHSWTGRWQTEGKVTVTVRAASCETPVLSELFSGPSISWCSGKDEKHEFAIADGEYNVMVAEPNKCYGCDIPSLGHEVRDFIVDVDLRVISGNGEVGVAFRCGDPWYPRYTLCISGDGRYEVYRRDTEGKDTYLVRYTSFKQLRSAPEWNHLTLAVKGSTILVFLNHFLAASLQDTSIETGGVRLMTCSRGGGSTEGRFDTLTVRTCDDVELPQTPTASFSFSPSDPNTSDSVLFMAAASSDLDGKIVSYEWDFGDGTHKSSILPGGMSHIFAKSGHYWVALTVTDNQGWKASKAMYVVIRSPNQAPTAQFTWQVLPAAGARLAVEPRVGDLIQFDASGSSDSDGSIVNYAWDWDSDGTYDAGSSMPDISPTIEHRFAEGGSHRVTLRVTDDKGATSTITKTVALGVPLPPQASFSFSPKEPTPRGEVQFANASTDPDGKIVGWNWQFGDSTTSTDQSPEHQYMSPGTYKVTLAVTDSDGLTGTTTLEVVVTTPPGSPRFARQWGVVIGVAEYDDPAVPDLQYTEADAQAFYDFLTDPRGGGFVRDNVRLLLNEEATTSAVKGAFSWLIQQAGKDDLVVIYFAGHGGTAHDLSQPPDEEDGVDEYLVTYDAKGSDLFSTAVRDDEIGDWLASFRSDHVVLIFDSCFAAGATRSLGQAGTRAGPGNKVFTDLVGNGRLFLAASQESEVSYEDTTLGHGVFTYYLLRGLGALGDPKTLAADADNDGRVTVEELETYLTAEVSKTRNQHPLVTGDLTLARVALSGYGEPLLGEVTALEGDRVVISLGSRQGVQVGDRFEVVHELLLPDGTTMQEVRAIIDVLYVLGSGRAVCRIVELFYPIELRDTVRVAS